MSRYVKVAFTQKVLMHLSFPQTDEPYYWILNLWYFKGLKSCQIRAWSGSEGSNSKIEPHLSLQSHFRPLCDMIWAFQNLTILKFKLRKIIRFICLRKWQMHQYFWIKATFSDFHNFYNNFYGLQLCIFLFLMMKNFMLLKIIFLSIDLKNVVKNHKTFR